MTEPVNHSPEPPNRPRWDRQSLMAIHHRATLQGGLAGVAGVAMLLAGCRGTPVTGEREARQQASAVTREYRPSDRPPSGPILTADSSLSDFLTAALLHQPKVEAAYFEWLAAVERITVQRSKPDPQLVFQMDIQEVVTSVMPGLMMSFPGREKLRAAGELAVAASQSGYYAFKTASLESAFAVKRAYYRLCFLAEKIRVNRESLALLEELERLARSRNEVGKATLQDVLRAQIEQERLRNEIANLEDSRGLLLAEWKSALGAGPKEPAPPVPARFESTPLDAPAEQWLEKALSENLRLRAMTAEIQAAEANLRLAYAARMPETSLGFMPDIKMNPVLYRPWGTVSLPIWRDKLRAQAAEAQAAKRAGEARLSSQQVDLAVEVAQRSFVYRETTRNLELLQRSLLPKQRQSLSLARSTYLASQGDFLDLAEAQQTLLRFSLDEVEARAQRELSLAELSLILRGMPPAAGGATGMEVSPAVMGRTARPGASNMGSESPRGMDSGGAAMLPGNAAPSSKMKP